MTIRPAPKPPMSQREPKRPSQRYRRHVPIHPNIRRAVFERDHFTCQWCHEAGGHLDPHHRQRRSQGGKDTPDNLVSVHRRCHRQIHERPAEARRRGFLSTEGTKD